LQRYGIRVSMAGLIARPVPQAAGPPIQGIIECARIFVWGDGMRPSAITDPLRRADRRVQIPNTRSLERGDVPRGGTLLDLLVSFDDTWRDLPDPKNPSSYHFLYDATEERGPFVLAMQEVFPPSRPPHDGAASQTGVRPECRIVCLGSGDALCNAVFDENRELLLNAFNWAASREFRVAISVKNPQVRRLDITSGSALSVVNGVAVFLLPGLCLVLGVWTAIKRRR
jgi:hypothetical protein